MPAPQLIPPPNVLRSITVELEDLTPDLEDAVRLTVRVAFSDGLTAVLVSTKCRDGSVGDIPDGLKELGDAFLWGDGAAAVIAWAQKRDRSEQARRVRRAL